jgi:hypothetical protein
MAVLVCSSMQIHINESCLSPYQSHDILFVGYKTLYLREKSLI